jgi:hypothetical protein
MADFFRPQNDPHRTIYDALVAEAEKRPGRSVNAWQAAEQQAAWQAARDYAQQHGLRVPTLEDVKRADRLGCGHVDYAAKVAYAVGAVILKK